MINRRSLCRHIVPLLIALMGAMTHVTLAADKPNILFIFADDHAYNAVGAYGNDQVKTPHIDRLASQGVTFSNAYNQGGWHGAVCVASRTMLNTGLFMWHARDAEKHADKVKSLLATLRRLQKQTGDPLTLDDALATR